MQRTLVMFVVARIANLALDNRADTKPFLQFVVAIIERNKTVSRYLAEYIHMAIQNLSMKR